MNEPNAEMSEQLNCKLKGADRWIQNVERNLSCLFDELEKTNESIQELHKSLTRLLEIRRETLAAAESLRNAEEKTSGTNEDSANGSANTEPAGGAWNNAGDSEEGLVRPVSPERDIDPLCRDAIELVFSEGYVTTTLLQRRLSIGYGRAVKILETLENEGTACLKRQAGITSTQMYKVVKPEGLHTDRFDSNGPGTDGVCLGGTKKASFCENCPTREDDPLYERAVALVMYYKFVTNKFFMTNLSIGRERAAKLIERMKDEGILDPI